MQDHDSAYIRGSRLIGSAGLPAGASSAYPFAVLQLDGSTDETKGRLRDLPSSVLNTSDASNGDKLPRT